MTGSTAHFRRRVLDAARGLLDGADAFEFGEIAAAMGAGFARGGPDARRLQRQLDALLDAGALSRPARARYGPGDDLAAPEAGGSGVALLHEIDAAFARNGGIMRPAELAQAVGVDGEAGERAIRRALESGGRRYRKGLPWAGSMTAWRLADRERRATILPGCKLRIDTRLEAAGRGDILHHLHHRRRAIGGALRRAREAAGLHVDAVVATPEIADALDACLSAGRGSVLTSGRTIRLAEWWRATVEEHGRACALAHAWARLEAGGQDGEPCVLDALDVAAWAVVGSVLGVDAAATSRTLH